METFRNLPVEDINYFLIINNIPISEDEDENYYEAYRLVTSGFHTGVAPESISNWVMNQNIYQQSQPVKSRGRRTKNVRKPKKITLNTNFSPPSTSSNFLPSSTSSNFVPISSTKPSYMNILPEELIQKILTDVDCNELLSLCNTNRQFKEYCDRNYRNILQDNLENKFGVVFNNASLEELLDLCAFYNRNKIYIDRLTPAQTLKVINIKRYNGISGYIDFQEKFRIFKGENGNVDMRRRNRGKLCNIFEKKDLIKILLDLSDRSLDQNDLINIYLEYTKVQLCETIKNKLIELELMIDDDLFEEISNIKF